LDGILIDQNETSLTADLKSAFGLSNITWDKDFVNILANTGIGSWQGRNWDPEVNDPTFDNYCANITSTSLLYPATADLRDRVADLIDASDRVKPYDSLITSMLNWIGYVNSTVVQPCAAGDQTQDQCYASTNATFFQQTDLSQSSWRSWTWQYCTQWGFYQTGSGAPDDILPLVSRLLDVPYLSLICRLSFNISGEDPDIDSVNKYGGFDIRYPRLAFVDGQADPWRWAGVHAPEAPRRSSTLSEPFIQIEDAVHHCEFSPGCPCASNGIAEN
jgi:Serine carboxypeptidase S28